MAKKRRNAKTKADNGIQTTIFHSGVDESPNMNITFPYGLYRTVKHYLDFVGVLKFVRGLKKESNGAARLDLILLAIIVHTLFRDNSMDACSRWLEDERVKKIFGFRKDENVSQKTIDRAVMILGKHREEILEKLWKGINDRFEITKHDIAVDGSAVVMYGPKSNMGGLGHPRDGCPGDLQIEFTVAILAELGIPVYIRPFKGNASDEEQYREAIPEISSLIQGKSIHHLDAYKSRGTQLDELAVLAKTGATIIADNGAASKENTDRAVKCGNDMITRMKLNASDVETIRTKIGDFEYIPELNVFCYEHRFESSDKTNYLYLSPELFMGTLAKKKLAIRKALDTYVKYINKEIGQSKIVSVRKVMGIEVKIDIETEDLVLDEFDDDHITDLALSDSGIKTGFFKLRSTTHLTPEEALRRYRQRAMVELTISSLKRITGIKPIRAWNEDSVGGSMVVALLAEAAMSMARYCLSKTYKRVDLRSGRKQKSYVPSTKTMKMELGHLTLTRFRNEKNVLDGNLSNWTPLTIGVFGDIRAHESPDWGSKKVPSSC